MRWINSGTWLTISALIANLLLGAGVSIGSTQPTPPLSEGRGGSKASVQLPTVEMTNRYPLARLNTGSPRATIKDFIETMTRSYQVQLREGYRSRKAIDLLNRSVRCLDLNKVPPTLVHSVGLESALLLKEVFDRIEMPPYEEIPDQHTMEAKKSSSWTLPHTEITIERIVDGPRKGEFLFTAETVARLPGFYKRVRDLPYRPAASQKAYESYIVAPGWMIPHQWIQGLPNWAGFHFLGQAVWQWVGLALSLSVGSWVIWAIYRRTGRRFSMGDDHVASRWQFGKLLFPLGVMVVTLLVDYFVDEQINITGPVLKVILLGSKLILYVFAVLAIVAFGNIFAHGIMSSERLNPKSVDANLIALSFRVLTLILIFALFWYAAAHFGLPVTAVFASAGVAGVAIAFAARETVANFFGGMSILFDRPFKTGDFVVLDSGERGEVIQIGLRSTRILTRDEILICIPNSVITNAKIVNESAPNPRFRIRIKVGVAYGTDINQVEDILIRLARNNPLVANEPEPRVRFRNFGDSSLDFELLCWAQRPHDKGRLTHQLNKDIYKTFHAAGILIPFPQRDIHMYSYLEKPPEPFEKGDKEKEESGSIDQKQ